MQELIWWLGVMALTLVMIGLTFAVTNTLSNLVEDSHKIKKMFNKQLLKKINE